MIPIATTTVLVGLGATALIDLWALLRRRLFAVPLPDYRLLGRWIGHMPRGRFVHDNIRMASPVRGETALGWSAHGLIGIGFAALLPLLWGTQWLHAPSLLPALLIGVATTAAPLLLMQPGMGGGIGGRRTGRALSLCLQSLTTHTLFGVGLYLGARLLQAASAA
jgi:hypothetical protein